MISGVRALLMTPQSVRAGGTELVEAWQRDQGGWIWLDIEGGADGATLESLVAAFGLSPVHLEEAMQDRHPPALGRHDGHFFILVKPLDAESYSLDFSTQQLALFLGPRFLVTRHSKHSPYLKRLQDRLEEGTEGFSEPAEVARLLLQRMISRYGSVLLDLERRLDEIEDQLLSEPDENLLQELLGYNTALRKMRRILRYHEEIMQDLATAKVDPTHEAHWEQLAVEARRFHSLAEMYQGMIKDLIDGYISLNGHHLNQVMRLLTVVTVIFVPLTLLVGIYGMNFEYIPELHHRYGYFVLLGVMALVAAGLVWYFRRRRWL